MLRKGKFYSTKEVVKLTRVSRQTLYNWLAAGKIKPPLTDQLSGQRLYSKKDVDTIIKMREGG